MINENYEFAKDYLNQRRIINDKNQEKNRNNCELSTMDSKANDVKKLIFKLILIEFNYVFYPIELSNYK